MSQEEKKILRVGALARIGTMDIREADDSVSGMILREVFETPYAPAVGTELPVPVLFADQPRLEPSDPSRPVYSAPVRPDIVFSDGTPLTADIVRQSLSKADDINAKATVETSGDRVIFRLKSPNPKFALVLTQNFCGIVLAKGGQLFGTGPFMFRPGSTLPQLLQSNPLVLIKNPRYRAPVKIDEIAFSIYPAAAGGGTENLLEAAKKGEIDFTYSLTSVDAAKLMGYPLVPSISTGNATGMMHFNLDLPALQNPVLRKAIALALDRHEIAKKTYEKNPLAFVASSLLPPLMGHHGRDALAHNLRDAKALIEAAAIKPPERLKLLITWCPRPYLPNPREAGETIKQQLAAIGIAIEIVVPRDRPDFFNKIKRGDYELALAGWIADTPDPADFLEALLSSAMIPNLTKVTATSNNMSRFKNAAMDQALARFRGEPTDAHRAEIFRILAEEVPLVPLIYGQAVAVYSNRVRGFRASPIGRTSLAKLELGK